MLAMRRCDVLANRVSAEPVDAAFALFEVDRVRWQVPMHYRMAPPVEVDPFLSNAGGRKNERPERTIERISHLWSPDTLRVTNCTAIPQRKSHRDRNPRELRVGGSRVVPRRAERQRFDRTVGNLAQSNCIDPRASELKLQLEAVFVEHRLQVAINAISEHRLPIRLVVPVDLVDEKQHVHTVEERPHGVRQSGGRAPQFRAELLIELTTNSGQRAISDVAGAVDGQQRKVFVPAWRRRLF